MTSTRVVRLFLIVLLVTSGALILANRNGGGVLPAGASTAAAQDLEAEGFERILRQRDNGTFSKAGWNHYGPGYFELDARTGVLSSSGGMGLFWYAAQQYGDFVLDLEFMAEVAQKTPHSVRHSANSIISLHRDLHGQVALCSGIDHTQ